MYTTRILTEAEANNAIFSSKDVPTPNYNSSIYHIERVTITSSIEAILEEQDKKTLNKFLEILDKMPISLKDYSLIENKIKELTK
jgi:hypothetical protein